MSLVWNWLTWDLFLFIKVWGRGSWEGVPLVEALFFYLPKALRIVATYVSASHRFYHWNGHKKARLTPTTIEFNSQNQTKTNFRTAPLTHLKKIKAYGTPRKRNIFEILKHSHRCYMLLKVLQSVGILKLICWVALNYQSFHFVSSKIFYLNCVFVYFFCV